MPIEETLLDPPITPAPIFAYRALRGWFVGSPDSSPERDNKENISPVNSHRKSVDSFPSHNAPKLSPQKRKRDSDPQVSPTKSILRTPGAPTPRAKVLRDVNVKFKSLSPEMRRKSAAVAVNPEQQPNDAVRKKSSGKTLSESTPAQTAQPEAQLESQQTRAFPSTVSETDFEDHFRRTEKEMKRLIRYGQKWRDLARRQDEENTKLRVMLETAQMENRRLEAALRTSGTPIEKPSASGKEQQVLSRETDGHSGRDAATATTIGKAATTRHGKEPSVNAALSVQEQAIEDLLDLTPPTEFSHPATSAAQRATSAPTSNTLGPSTALPAHHAYKTQPSHPRTSVSNPLPQRLAPPSSSVPAHSPLTALQHRIEGSILPLADTAARTRMPVDRVAAVRKRLLAKDQARKAGLSVLGDVGLTMDSGRRAENQRVSGFGKGKKYPGGDGNGAVTNKGSGRQGDVENSGFDWVGV